MAQGWHYGGLIGKQPVGSGSPRFRTSAVRGLPDAGAEFTDPDGMRALTSYQFSSLSNTGVGVAADLSSEISVSSQNFMRALTFSADGTKMYVLHDNNSTLYYAEDDVVQWDLSTPFDVTTRSNQQTEPNVFGGSNRKQMWSLKFKSDGTKAFVFGLDQSGEAYDTVTNHVASATLSTAWDITTAGTWSNVELAQPTTFPGYAGGDRYGMYGWHFNGDGTKLFCASTVSNHKYIYQYTLPSAWNTSAPGSPTAVKQLDTLITSPSYSTMLEHQWVKDGTEAYILNAHPTLRLTFSTAYDWSTASYNSADQFTANVAGERCLAVNAIGTKLILGAEDGEVREYALGTEVGSYIGKPTQRWGRQLGRSPFDGTALRNTGIITTTEAYQLQL